MTDTASAWSADAEASPDAAWRRAVDRFVLAQREDLLGFLRHRIASEGDAEDATQECFVRLLQYVRSEPLESWKPLLYRIAANVAIDQARRARRRHTARHVSVNDVDIDSLEPAHEERISREQEMLRVRQAILALPPKCQQVYLLRLEGRSYRAIAEHCGISVKAVEKHITKALAAVRREVGFSSLGAL